MSEGDSNQVPPIPPQEPGSSSSQSSPPPISGATPPPQTGPSFAEKAQAWVKSPQIPYPPSTSPEERSWAVAIHVSALISHILGPLILWLIKRPTSVYLDAVGKEAVNFQLSFLIYFIVVTAISFVTCGFGAILYFPLVIVWIVFVIIASVKVSNGEDYRYPFTIRFF